jgi:type I restriction enzyme S subunit
MEQKDVLKPKLRFEEFNSKWNNLKLSQISKFLNGRAYKQNELLSYGKYPVLRVGNFFTNNKWYYSDLELEDNKYCDKGDLLYAWSASFGPKIWQGNKVIYHYHIWKVVNNNHVLKDFLFIVLERETEKLKSNSANGFALLHITKATIENWVVNIPQKEEQQKIASFLSAVDTKIQQLEHKKELLEQYKKGIMQQLFNQELRFTQDDGSNYPDWEDRKLGKLTKKMQSGGTPKSTVKEYYNGDIPFLSINDMTTQGKYLHYTSKTVSKKGIENSSSWIVPKDSLIYSMYASVGFVSINKIEIATSQAVMNIILKDEVYLEYIYYYLLDFKRYIHRYIETGTQGNINASIVKEIDIKLPSTEEQSKIANFLSTIDSKIALVNTQITQNQTFKKGLLQQMFV